jgi:hypothetical protein
VIALEIDGRARAYPLRILLWHEIVNDTLAGTPVSVTFCPLCNAAVVFERRLDGVVLDFGTTGKLRYSDLVMYDRQTESWWQQFTGSGIVGEYAGRELANLPAPIVAFSDFRTAHGDGEVLSRDTGFRRDYGRNPYPGYDAPDARPFLLRGSPDPRLPPMQRVLGLDLDGKTVAYPLPQLAATGVANAVVGNTPVVLVARSGTLSALDAERIEEAREVPAAAAYDRRLDERTLEFERDDRGFRDRETGSTWNLLGQAIDGPLRGSRLRQVDRGVHFAFAWLAFHPESDVVKDFATHTQDKARGSLSSGLGRKSLECLCDVRHNCARPGAVSFGHVGRLVVTKPHLSALVLPGEHFERQVNAHSLGTLHKRRSSFGTAEDQQLRGPERLIDLRCTGRVIDAREHLHAGRFDRRREPIHSSTDIVLAGHAGQAIDRADLQ